MICCCSRTGIVMVYCYSRNAILMAYICSRIYRWLLTFLLGWINLWRSFLFFPSCPTQRDGPSCVVLVIFTSYKHCRNSGFNKCSLMTFTVTPASPHRKKIQRGPGGNRRNSSQSEPSSEADSAVDSPLSEPLNVDVSQILMSSSSNSTITVIFCVAHLLSVR